MDEVENPSGVSSVVRDLVIPDLQATGAKLEALEVQLRKNLELLSRQSDLEFKAIMTALDSLRAEMRSTLRS